MVDRAALEMPCPLPGPGFESRTLRQLKPFAIAVCFRKGIFSLNSILCFIIAVLLEGARLVGKYTIAEYFAENEHKSYILIDFSKATNEEISCFEDINDLDMFFLRLQAVTGKNLYVVYC